MKRKGFVLGGVLLALILIVFYFDFAIVQKVSLIRNGFLDDFFMGITLVSKEITIFLVLTGLFLWESHRRKWVLPLWITLVLSTLISFILKYSVQRLRPYQLEIVSTLPIFQEANHLIWNFSFPSYHALIAFCVVPLLLKEFSKLKYVWITFATLAAFSRVYFGVHFLSDVIAGGVIGCLIGWFVLHTYENWGSKHKIIKRKTLNSLKKF